jgi:hypothetical protein
VSLRALVPWWLNFFTTKALTCLPAGRDAKDYPVFMTINLQPVPFEMILIFIIFTYSCGPDPALSVLLKTDDLEMILKIRKDAENSSSRVG